MGDVVTEFDADDSNAIEHSIEPPTLEEVEAEIDAFFAEFTAPRFARWGR